jgi:outer membrane immunogenic protein
VKKLLLAGFAVSALSAPAIAADMPVPAAPVATWTGFYVGANAGYALSNTSVNGVGLPNNCTAAVNIGCIGLPGFVGTNVYGLTSAQAATFSTPSSQNGGFLGGGQFGYNYQLGTNSVIGLEADLQAMANNNHAFTFASSTTVPGTAVPGFQGFPVNQTATVSTKLDFLGTIRARAGYLWTPEFLLYITAGLAYGEAELNSTITQNTLGFAPYTAVGSSSNVRFGGAIGAGLEWMLFRNWSVRAEYLYVGLDNRGAETANSALINRDVVNGGNLSSVTVLTSARFNENIARGAVNYHF